MIKGSVQGEDVTFVKTYTLNIEAPKYIKQTLTGMKGEIDRNTITVGDPHCHPTDINGQIFQTENQ